MGLESLASIEAMFGNLSLVLDEKCSEEMKGYEGER